MSKESRYGEGYEQSDQFPLWYFFHVHDICAVNDGWLTQQHTTRIRLLVLTDHPDPELVFLLFTVSKSGEKGLRSTKHLALSDRSARPTEFCHDVLVDPSGTIAVVSIYTGRLKVITLAEEGGYAKDFDTSSAYNFIVQRAQPR